MLVFSAVGFLVENLWDTRTKFEKLNYGAIWVVFVINVVMGEWLSQVTVRERVRVRVSPNPNQYARATPNPNQYALLIAIISGLVWGVFAFAVHFARKSVTTASIPGARHRSA